MIGIIFTGFPRRSLMAMPTLGAYRLRTFMARHGHDIEVVDFVDYFTDDELLGLISKRATDGLLFVGFGVTFIQQDRVALLDAIRARWPHLRIIIGAQEPRLEHYVRSGRFRGRIDMLFMGFAEVALLRYIEHLSGLRDTFETSGTYMDQPYVISDRVHPCRDVSDLSVEWRGTDTVRWVKALPIEISRGCVFRCRFCNHSLTGKSKMDYIRDETNLADEFRRNHELFGIRTYLLADDTFNDTEHKLRLVARAIERSGVDIRFSAYLRYELLHRNPHHIGMLRDMGLHHANLGIESMNERARKAIGKGLSNDQLLEVLSNLRSAGMTTNSNFIVGLPHETEEDLRATNEWMLDTGKRYLTSWFWSPLWIGNHIHMRSEFEMEAAKHGYSVDPNDEMRWWGPTMDSVTAEGMCEEFNERARFVRGPVGFETTELIALGLEPEDMLGRGEYEICSNMDRDAVVLGITDAYRELVLRGQRHP